jgi:hypothetical protein
MKIRTAIAAGLLALAVTSCSSGTPESAPPPSTSASLAVPVTSPTSSTTTTSTTATGPLSATWVPRLTSLALESCRGNPFTATCLTDAMALQTAAVDVGQEARSRGLATVTAAADKVVSDLDRWVQECATTTAGSPARTKCLSVIMQLPQQHEDLIAAIYAAEAK